MRTSSSSPCQLRQKAKLSHCDQALQLDFTCTMVNNCLYVLWKYNKIILIVFIYVNGMAICQRANSKPELS